MSSYATFNIFQSHIDVDLKKLCLDMFGCYPIFEYILSICHILNRIFGRGHPLTRSDGSSDGSGSSA